MSIDMVSWNDGLGAERGAAADSQPPNSTVGLPRDPVVPLARASEGISDGILATIGGTPLVRLRQLLPAALRLGAEKGEPGTPGWGV
jgi:hypothetical protein